MADSPWQNRRGRVVNHSIFGARFDKSRYKYTFPNFQKFWTAALEENYVKFGFSVYTPKIGYRSNLAMIFIIKFRRIILHFQPQKGMIWIEKDFFFLESKDLAKKDSLGAQKNHFDNKNNGLACRCTTILNMTRNNALRS